MAGSPDDDSQPKDGGSPVVCPQPQHPAEVSAPYVVSTTSAAAELSSRCGLGASFAPQCPPGDQTGLLLGAAGSQLVLDGAPIEGAHSERSFALMLSTAGLASIQFLPKVNQDEFARFVRGFPTGNAKSSSLAEQLKSALAGADGIRLNEVRFVAEDASMPENRLAALTAKTLGADTSQMRIPG